VTRASRNTVSAAAENSYLADVALAANFDELLAEARAAEQDFRSAQASGTPAGEQYPLAKRLDAALTAAMKAAYAAERAEIGPRGYEDRIYRRKAKAKPAVHALTDEAERLLTLRESYQLTGFPARPEAPALGVQIARLPSH
jgi:flagellar hook-length control protein FliK